MNLAQAVQSLIDAFPSRGVTPATAAIYLEDLSDLPEPLVVAAIAHFRRTATFLPAIGEIRTRVVETACGIPSEDDAWREVKEALKQPPGAGPWDVSPAVLQVVREIGTWELRNDLDGKAAQRFRSIYRDRRAELVKAMAAGSIELPAAIAAPGLRAIS